MIHKMLFSRSCGRVCQHKMPVRVALRSDRNSHDGGARDESVVSPGDHAKPSERDGHYGRHPGCSDCLLTAFMANRVRNLRAVTSHSTQTDPLDLFHGIDEEQNTSRGNDDADGAIASAAIAEQAMNYMSLTSLGQSSHSNGEAGESITTRLDRSPNAASRGSPHVGVFDAFGRAPAHPNKPFDVTIGYIKVR